MDDKISREAAGYESIRQFFKNRKNIINLFGIPLAIYTVFLLYRIISSAFGNTAAPNEYREVANIQLTQQFIKGINPYSMDALKGSVPGIVYVYGPLYSLVTALLSFIIPADIITLHYIVTLTAILISASLAAFMVHEHTDTITSPLAGFLFIIICTWRYGYVNAVPDAFAMMLMMFILFFESRKTFRGREMILALFTIAIFFTKQYFLMILATLVIFKFLTDRKALKKYLINTAVLSAAVIIAVSVTCPLYWTYSVFFAHGPFGLTAQQYENAYGNKLSSIGDTTSEAASIVQKALASDSKDTDPPSGFAYEFLQLKTLGGTFLFMFLMAAAGIIRSFSDKFKHTPDYMKLFIIHIFLASVCLLYLGRNSGAWLSYYLQLLMPAVIIYSVIVTEELIINADSRKKAAVYLAMMFMLIFFTAFRTDRRLPVYTQTAQEREEWESAYKILDTYCSKGEVYYYPLLGFNALENGQLLYNNGHSMVITGWFNGEWEALEWEQKLFPEAGNIMEKNIAYQDEIVSNVRMGKYSLITYIQGVDDDLGRMTLSDIKAGPYKKLDTIRLNAGRMSYNVQFWARE